MAGIELADSQPGHLGSPINKVSLTHSCAHSFTSYPRLLLCYKAELIHCHRDSLALEAENISSLALSSCLQTPPPKEPETWMSADADLGLLGLFPGWHSKEVGSSRCWRGVGTRRRFWWLTLGRGWWGYPPGRGHSRLQGGMGLSAEIARLMEAQQDHRQEAQQDHRQEA